MVSPTALHIAADQRQRRKERLLFFSLVILVVLSLMGYQLWAGYQAQKRGAESEARNYAAIMEARLDATLRRIDADMLDMMSDFPMAALNKQAVPRYARKLNAELKSHRVNFQELAGLRIFDANGDQLYAAASAPATGLNVADRNYFRQLRDNPQSGLVFSSVMPGRYTPGQTILVAARALTDARGLFRGVLVSAIALNEFENLFQSLHIGAQGLLVIRRSDNFQTVVRWPPMVSDINRELPRGVPTRVVVESGQKEGVFEFAARTDDVVRIFGFRVLERYPFYVVAALAHEDVMASWRKIALSIAISGVLLLGMLTNFLYRLWRSEGREAQMLTDLAASGDKVRLLASVFEHSNEAIMITDRNNCIVETNPAFSRLTGYSFDDVRGRNPRVLSSGRTTKEAYQAMWRSIRETGTWRGELWDKNKDGSVYPKWLTISVIEDEEGHVEYHIANFIDISERKNAEEKIAYLAHHDALTGLSNRHSLEDRLDQVLAMARREHSRVTMMFIDMDRFKSINDSFGHHAGDGLLKEVAARLVSSVRESDVVARLGGDEFVVMLNKVDASMVMSLAEKIRNALAQPYDIEGHALYSTPSIGVATFPDDGADADTLMKHADTAMYCAKLAGRNAIRVFSADMNVAATLPRAPEDRP
jgi:diguanylate cyclase (GGDEF)-like protein/PAS domain S-box-containing protein